MRHTGNRDSAARPAHRNKRSPTIVNAFTASSGTIGPRSTRFVAAFTSPTSCPRIPGESSADSTFDRPLTFSYQNDICTSSRPTLPSTAPDSTHRVVGQNNEPAIFVFRVCESTYKSGPTAHSRPTWSQVAVVMLSAIWVLSSSLLAAHGLSLSSSLVPNWPQHFDAGHSFAVQATGGNDTVFTPEIDTIAKTLLAQTGVPGLSVGVVRLNGSDVRTEFRGWGNMTEDGQLVQPEVSIACGAT